MMPVSDVIEMYFSFMVWAMNSWVRDRYAKDLYHFTQPLCDYVASYQGPLDVLHKCLERIIHRVVETHRMRYVLHGKRSYVDSEDLVHHSLIALLRVAFWSNFPNSSLITRILQEIYSCEKDFRCILYGAYDDHGKDPLFQLYTNLYASREEGVRALAYYLQHTNVTKKLFWSQEVPFFPETKACWRMADLGLVRQNFDHPAIYAMAKGRKDIFLVLAKYGANLNDQRKPAHRFCVKERIQNISPEHLPIPQNALHWYSVEPFRELFFYVHPELRSPVGSLEALCRKVIRKALYDNFQLPWGIYELPLPLSLQRYLDVAWWLTKPS